MGKFYNYHSHSQPFSYEFDAITQIIVVYLCKNIKEKWLAFDNFAYETLYCIEWLFN